MYNRIKNKHTQFSLEPLTLIHVQHRWLCCNQCYMYSVFKIVTKWFIITQADGRVIISQHLSLYGLRYFKLQAHKWQLTCYICEKSWPSPPIPALSMSGFARGRLERSGLPEVVSFLPRWISGNYFPLNAITKIALRSLVLQVSLKHLQNFTIFP